jgi:hypothetical protein
MIQFEFAVNEPHISTQPPRSLHANPRVEALVQAPARTSASAKKKRASWAAFSSESEA